MDERQLTAIRSCEKSAVAIAKRHGWDEPRFYQPHSDYAIEFWRAADALATFLAKVEKLDSQREKATEPEKVVKQENPVVTTPVTGANFSEVVGIGAVNEKALHDAGYLTWGDVLQAGIAKIEEDVPTIAASRVRALYTRAQREAK